MTLSLSCFEILSLRPPNFIIRSGQTPQSRTNTRSSTQQTALALLSILGAANIGERRKHQDEENENCRRGVPNLHGAQCRGRFTERKPGAESVSAGGVTFRWSLRVWSSSKDGSRLLFLVVSVIAK